eukprot:11627813-Alexandrium_andersonii.AAC.1
MILAPPQRTSASVSALWLQVVAQLCRLLPRRGRQGSRQAPAVLADMAAPRTARRGRCDGGFRPRRQCAAHPDWRVRQR